MRRRAILAVTALVLGVTAPITVPFFGGVADAQVRVGESSAEDCDNEVDVQVDQDACAKTLAVSGSGDASGVGTKNECGRPEATHERPVAAGCISVSGTGNASNSGGCGWSFLGVGAGCVAVSGTGNATNAGVQCGNGSGVAAGCVAVSGEGDASNTGHSCGQAFGFAVVPGVAVGCVAVSGTGTASNGGNWCGASKAGVGVGCVAVSGTGDASNTDSDGPDSTTGSAGSCGHAGSGGAGIITPVGTIMQPGVAVGCVAVSGTGNASNNTSNDNSCGKTNDNSPGFEVAVGCVEIEAGSPVQP